MAELEKAALELTVDSGQTDRHLIPIDQVVPLTFRGDEAVFAGEVEVARTRARGIDREEFPAHPANSYRPIRPADLRSKTR